MPRLYPTHEDALEYTTIIWKALLLAMHGKKLELDLQWSVRTLVLFFANLHTYAEYLMLNDEVKLHLLHSILDIPGIWDFVKENPRASFHLGHDFQVPNLYLDAARHLIGKEHPSVFRSAGHRPDENEPDLKLLAYFDFPPFDHEMLSLLHSGSLALRDAATNLSQELIRVVIMSQNPDVGYGAPWRSVGIFWQGKRGDEIAKALTSLLSPQVLDVACLLLRVNRRDPHRVGESSCGPGQAAFHALRNLQKSLSEQSDHDLEERFQLRQLARRVRAFLPNLGLAMKGYMNQILELIRETSIFQEPDHEYTPNVADPKLPLKSPVHAPNCAKCFRARSESDEYFTYFDTRQAYPGWAQRPWPLTETASPCLHSKQAFLEELETTPATLSWLTKIGLGDEFKHHIESRNHHLLLQSQRKR